VPLARSLSGLNTAVFEPSKLTVPGTTSDPSINVKDAAFIDIGLIASLKVATIELFKGKFIPPFVGTVETTMGTVVWAAPVVKLQTKFWANWFPPRQVTPVVIVAVYAVLGERLAAGVKIAVSNPSKLTVPWTGVLPCIKVKVPVLTVEASIASLKKAMIESFTGTLVLAANGLFGSTGKIVVDVGIVLTTNGVTVSISPVVKVQLKF